MKKILPIAEPIINYIPWTNNISAVINTNFRKYGDCLYKKFIQMADHGNHNFMFDEYNLALDIYDCFLPFSLPKYLFRSKGELRDEIVNLIDKGYYVYTTVQTYHISPYSNYKSRYRYHDMMIFGVDTEAGTFNCADFFKEYYSYETCDIDEVIEAIYDHALSEHGGSMPYFNNLVCFKLIDTYGDLYYSDNTNKILTSLYSVVGRNLTVNSKNEDIYPRFGLSVFDGVISRLTDRPFEDDTHNDGYYLYKMNFHFFSEHIKLMKNRIIYLGGEIPLQDYVKTCDELVDVLLSCRNVVMKYAARHVDISDNSKKDLSEKIMRTKERYRTVILALTDYLESL